MVYFSTKKVEPGRKRRGRRGPEMMRQIIAWGLQARVLVLAIAVGLMFFGSTQLREMPVDTLPEFQPTTVHVQAEALGLSAAEVEQLVTVPLEQDLLSLEPVVVGVRSELG